MKRITGLLLAGLVMTSVVHAEQGADDPAAVTKAAYQVDLKHFGFDAETLHADKPGQYTLDANVSFFLCTDAWCQRMSDHVSVAITVE